MKCSELLVNWIRIFVEAVCFEIIYFSFVEWFCVVWAICR